MVTRVSEAMIDRAKAVLSDGISRTCREIAEALGVTRMSTYRAVNTLYERRQIYIADYQRCAKNGDMVPMYAVGQHPDAANSEIVVKGKPFRSWLDIALFGEPASITTPAKWRVHVVRQSMVADDEELAA